jgi:effector-binding domain-containing protein
MKALLKFLYIILALVIIVLLAGLFLPKEAYMDSSVSINAPDEIVFAQINDLKNWKVWSPWEAADSTMEVSYGSETVGKGASYSWTGKHSGEGRLVITESVPVSKVAIELDFGEQGRADSYWTIESEGKLTNLTWFFENNNLSYFERYFMVLFRKNMINTFNTGLTKIKEIAEDLRLSRISEVKLVSLEKQPAMVITDSCEMEKMDSLMVVMYNRLFAYIERRQLVTAGPPFTIYYSWNPDGISKFACGLPLEKKTWGWKDYQVIELPEGEAATVIHWGRYDSNKPYIAINNFLQDKGLKQGDFIWEVYLNDPQSEPDTGMWQKQLYYPIQKDE